MHNIHNIIKELGIKPTSYRVIDDSVICNNKYIIRKNDKPIYEELKKRTFDYIPKTLIIDNYEIVEYLKLDDDKEEHKIYNLIKLISLLHTKTTYYKRIDSMSYLNIYEEYKNKIIDIENYYSFLMDEIEKETFLSPSHYFIARNISLIFYTLNDTLNKLDKWYKKYKDNTRARVSIINNNLSSDHLIDNKIVSWRHAKIGNPIFDLYSLYKNTYKLEWIDILDKYNSCYPLHEEELELFFILINIPYKIELNKREYLNVSEAYNLVDYLNKTKTLPDNFKERKENNP